MFRPLMGHLQALIVIQIQTYKCMSPSGPHSNIDPDIKMYVWIYITVRA